MLQISHSLHFGWGENIKNLRITRMPDNPLDFLYFNWLMMSLSKALSLNIRLIIMTGLAIFPATYRVLGFLEWIALEITLEITDDGELALGLA
jgi:hypothetical protein